MSVELKTVKQIFPDIEIDAVIAEAKIKNVNLYKKTNQLVMELMLAGKIDLINIYKFENFLKIRFKVKDAKLIIENNTDFNVDIEWNNIVKYINAKHPMTRAILVNSKPIINEKIIQVQLAVKGIDFLVARGFEKELEEILSNFYNQKLKVQYVEKLDEELIKKYEENTRRVERLAIELAEQEITADLESINSEEGNKSKKEEKNNSNQAIKQLDNINNEVNPTVLQRGK